MYKTFTGLKKMFKQLKKYKNLLITSVFMDCSLKYCYRLFSQLPLISIEYEEGTTGAY